MPQVGDAKGEYRGTTYRNDAALKAWLAKRPTEAALEPDLPIIDPHHHFWDTPQRGHYLLPELLADIGGGHNIVSTVFLECRAMYRKDGPREMAPLGEVEFVNGIAAMSASGGYGPCRVAEAIIGDADLTIGARVREVLEAEIARGRRALPRHPPRRVLGRQRGGRQVRLPRRAAAPGARPEVPRGLRPAGAARPELRVLAVSSATAGRDRPGARLSRTPPSSSIMSAACSASGLIPAAGRRSSPAGARTSTNWPNVRTSTCKLGGIGMVSFGFDFHERDVPPSSEDLAAAWRQYIEPCIEAFGVNRCMFESNFPPDKQSCGYTELWNAFKRITASASASEKTALYSGTAARVYRLTG